MTIRELYHIIDRENLFIHDENYQMLVSTNIRNQTCNEYHKACDIFRKLAQENKHVVTKIQMLEGSNPCIAIEIKEAE